MPNHIVMLISNAFRPDPRALNEARGLSKLGHSITILAWDRTSEWPKEETIDNQIRVIRIQNIPSGYGIGLKQFWRLPRFWLAAFSCLSRLHPDLIHCHDLDTLPIGLLWAKWHRKPVIYDAREYYAELYRPRLHGIWRWVMERLIQITEPIGAHLASAVITVDETLGRHYARYNPRVTIIGHYPRRELAEKPSNAFLHPSLHMIYVGRLSIDRGLLVYADILRHLLEQDVPARLSLLGVFTPPQDAAIFQNYALGLEKYLSIQPWIHYDHIPSILRQADLGLAILMPEHRYVAALPVKLFDYMAAGLPVVISHFPANSAIVREADCGLLVDPLADPRIIGEQIHDLWSNPSKAHQMGENGRMSILKKYNWEALMAQLENLYHSLLTQPRR